MTKPLKRKKDRPKNKSKKLIDFEDTLLGRFFLIYAPLEYFLLWEYNRFAKSPSEKYLPISYQSIENIALKSSNPAFKTIRFRKALIEYRRFGLRPKRKAKWNLTDAIQYAKGSYYIIELMKKCTE